MSSPEAKKSKSTLALEIEKAQQKKEEREENTARTIALKILKYTIILGVLVILILALTNYDTTLKILESYIKWMENNLGIGLILYVLLYTALHTLAIPGITLTIAIGFVFGRIMPTYLALPISSFIAWFASSAGCTVAFLNGRYVMRSLVLSWIVYCIPSKKDDTNTNNENNKKSSKDKNTKNGSKNGVATGRARRNSVSGSITATAVELGTDIILILEHIVETNGALVVILLRSNLILPYNIINYGMAITDVSVKRYLIGNLGVIPDSIIYCFVGVSVGTLSDIENSKVSDNTTLYVIFICVAVVSFSLLLGLIVYATKRVKKLISEAKAEQVEQLTQSQKDLEKEYNIEPIDPNDGKTTNMTIEDDNDNVNIDIDENENGVR